MEAHRLEPRQEPEQGNLPPPAARWLPAAVNGTLVAVVFSLPMPPALLAPVPILIAWRRYGRAIGLATAVVAFLSVFCAPSAASARGDWDQWGLGLRLLIYRWPMVVPSPVGGGDAPVGANSMSCLLLSRSSRLGLRENWHSH